MKPLEEMTIREIVLELKNLENTQKVGGITYEKEHDLGFPLLKEYEKRYNEKVQGIAKKFNKRAPKYRKFRWDERHLINVPLGD